MPKQLLTPAGLNKCYKKGNIYVFPTDIWAGATHDHVTFWLLQGDPAAEGSFMCWALHNEPLDSFGAHEWPEILLPESLRPVGGRDCPF